MSLDGQCGCDGIGGAQSRQAKTACDEAVGVGTGLQVQTPPEGSETGATSVPSCPASCLGQAWRGGHGAGGCWFLLGKETRASWAEVQDARDTQVSPVGARLMKGPWALESHDPLPPWGLPTRTSPSETCHVIRRQGPLACAHTHRNTEDVTMLAQTNSHPVGSPASSTSPHPAVQIAFTQLPPYFTHKVPPHSPISSHVSKR